MRDSLKTEIAQISMGTAYEVFTRSGLLNEVSREVHTRLPETIRQHAHTLLPDLATAAVAAATPDPIVVRAGLRADLREDFEADARDLVTRAANGLLPALAEDAVRTVTPDAEKVRAELVEAATRDLTDLIRSRTAEALASVVDQGIEQVRGAVAEVVDRETSRLIPELARTAITEATPDLAELLDVVTNQARVSAVEAVEGEAGKAVPAVVEAAVATTLTQVHEAVDAARQEACAAIGLSVNEAVDRKLAEFTPNVVTVVLPDRKPVTLGSDAHEVLPELLVALHGRCHVLLVGPAGTGKSMLAKHAALALDIPFQALSLGPTTPMSKVFGYFDAHGHYHDTAFRRAFEHGGVMLLDELDNGHPGLLAELNQALALGTCAFADRMVDAHPDFRLVATGNTYGAGGDRQYVGRQTLDSATLDRFVVIDVPIDEGLEERITLRHAPSHQDEALDLLGEIRVLRAIAAEKNLPVLFSPRASIDGARLLEAGATIDQVMQWRVIRGLSAAHRTALGLS